MLERCPEPRPWTIFAPSLEMLSAGMLITHILKNLHSMSWCIIYPIIWESVQVVPALMKHAGFFPWFTFALGVVISWNPHFPGTGYLPGALAANQCVLSSLSSQRLQCSRSFSSSSVASFPETSLSINVGLRCVHRHLLINCLPHVRLFARSYRCKDK